MLLESLGAGASGLLSLTLLGVMPASSQEPDEPPPPKKKDASPRGRARPGRRARFARKKGEEEPEGDLNRAYNVFRGCGPKARRPAGPRRESASGPSAPWSITATG